MRRARLFLQLFPGYVLLMALALAAVTVYAGNLVYEFHLDQTASTLVVRARAFEALISQPLLSGDFQRVDAWCETIGKATASRVTVILPSGRVAGDTQGDAETMENHRDRAEVADALAGGVGRQVRFSVTLQQVMLYVAVPMRVEDGTAAVIRVAVPLASVDAALHRLNGHLGLAAALAGLAATLAALVILRRALKPLEELAAYARNRVGSGATRIPAPSGSAETVALVHALNDLESQFQGRLGSLQGRYNELTAVLSSMVEGVLAVDANGRLLSLNQAAAGLLHLELETAVGRPLRERVRNPDLHEFLERVLAVAQPMEDEMLLYLDGERHVHVHGTVLADSTGRPAGAVLVLHDVTHVRRLERVRRDFVANVSHELRTPVTSIKGYVETLIEGAAEDAEARERFLNIIQRQADRLNEIIHDLLALAQIEQDARGGIAREPSSICPILEAAIAACNAKAAERTVDIQLQCDSSLVAPVNPPLLELAIVNLLDNAIKYSESKDTIEVKAMRDDGFVSIRVTDHGPGIERQHLSRLFERFYRVDRARSRRLGGTGLGLAIVKHIAQAHGGQVGVESKPGIGSTFTLHLPLHQE